MCSASCRRCPTWPHHTEVITTSPKVKIQGAVHIPFDEHNALEIACTIVRRAIDNYPNRKTVQIPNVVSDVVPGFSHEYINYMLGGSFRASLRPLNDAVASGRIRGVAANVGRNNPRMSSRMPFTIRLCASCWLTMCW